MKQNANHITMEEAEQLCRLYMDCQLSVLEETELEYVLMQSELDSPLLHETRALMGISRSVNLQAKKKSLFVTWGWRAAACVAILIGCVALLRNHITTEKDAIANKEGVELSVKTTNDIDKIEIAVLLAGLRIKQGVEPVKIDPSHPGSLLTTSFS